MPFSEETQEHPLVQPRAVTGEEHKNTKRRRQAPHCGPDSDGVSPFADGERSQDLGRDKNRY